MVKRMKNKPLRANVKASGVEGIAAAAAAGKWRKRARIVNQRGILY